MATTTTRTTARTRADILENPEVANAEISAAVSAATKVAMPVINMPPDTLVTLPGGLLYKNRVITTAEVKELTGRDEETLARASQALNPFHFLDKLLRCGVIKIGDFEGNDIDKILGQLLIGDREMLILGIRRATYGEDIEVNNWKCVKCGNITDLTMQLSDIPVISLENPEEEITFDVPLKRDRTARVRLANGDDQIAVFDKQELTQAQRETILLSRCVEYITDSEGHDNFMQARPSMALELSVPDRHAILKEINSRQPGPKYDKIEYKCESCGEDSVVIVGIGDLFLDFGWV